MNFEDRVGDDKAERRENGDERRFKLGELMDFGKWRWSVGTEQIDPAWVKADYGREEYGIKMVGNTRES